MSEQGAVTNQFSLEWRESLDGRTRLGRVVNDRLAALHADLGGVESLSFQKRVLCERLIWQTMLIESMERALSLGQPVEHGKLVQCTNTLIGLCKTLGLERVARDVPDLQTYLKSRAAQ